MAEQLDPTADWPPELQRLWHEFVLSNELDSHRLPTTVREAWNRVIQVQGYDLSETIQAHRDLLNQWRAEDQLMFISNAEPGVCVACGTEALVKTYRTKVWAQGLCQRCFRRRVLDSAKSDSTPEREHHDG